MVVLFSFTFLSDGLSISECIIKYPEQTGKHVKIPFQFQFQLPCFLSIVGAYHEASGKRKGTLPFLVCLFVSLFLFSFFNDGINWKEKGAPLADGTWEQRERERGLFCAVQERKVLGRWRTDGPRYLHPSIHSSICFNNPSFANRSRAISQLMIQCQLASEVPQSISRSLSFISLLFHSSLNLFIIIFCFFIRSFEK